MFVQPVEEIVISPGESINECAECESLRIFIYMALTNM